MNENTEEYQIRKSNVWLNIIFPMIVFLMSVLFIVANPISTNSSPLNTHSVQIFTFSANIGILALILYYCIWLWHLDLESKGLLSPLLLSSLMWLCYNLLLTQTDLFEFSDFKMMRYILFLILLLPIMFVWGTSSMQLLRRVNYNTPVFIIFSITISLMIYALSVIPVILAIGVLIAIIVL